MSQGFKRGSKGRSNKPAYSFYYVIHQFQLATRITSPDITTVFHAWPYDRFIEIQNNLRRKKLHRTNQGSNFLGGTFSIRDNLRAHIHRRESQPSILKDDFSRTDPSIFT